jgi:hypothetical protein
MRVSLAPVRKKFPGSDAEKATDLLDSHGARVVLGQASAMGVPDRNALVSPIAPAADTLFGPRGAVLASPEGPLFVCDTGHHRLLIWNGVPKLDGTPADLVIGQPDFATEGRNAKGDVGPATLNVPTGIATGDGVLAVADAWNHRVLIWHRFPTRSNEPADVVLGQEDFTGGLANRGTATASADTLNWCYGVTISDGALYVADTGNRRVLKWNRIPSRNGTPADLVLGEADFITRDENAGHAAAAAGMRWPHGIAVAQGRLFVADAGNNRVMVWNEMPTSNGAACSFVLGQKDFASVDHNMAAYYPTAAALNMPYGLAVFDGRLAIADTANSRLVAHKLDGLEMTAPANRLAGQRTFHDKGDNRWLQPWRDSLCWPYGIAACGSTLVIADSGNNRVLLWEAAP